VSAVAPARSPDPARTTAARRTVEVAVDAAGPGGSRLYTYHVPPRFAGLVAGEAVLVEFGRRQALGVVFGDVDVAPGVETKPILEQVRSDGPLLPPLQLELARWIASHYLAPPAVVIRAMLPPRLLERLELVASALPEPRDGTSEADPLDALLRGGPTSGVPVAELPADGGRAALLRRLRALEREGRIRLEWRILPGEARPRVERRFALTDAGRSLVRQDGTDGAGHGEPAGRRLGPRQLAALDELGALPPGESAAGTRLAARHGHSALAGLARRGLVRIEDVVVERRPLADRAPGRRGALPEGADLTAEQRDALAIIAASIEGHDATPVLLDGATGAGKTAVYAAVIATALAAGGRALVLVPEVPQALPLVDRLRHDLGADVALVHSGLSDGERADEWRRIRAGDVDVVLGTRLAVLAPIADLRVVIVDEEHEATYKQDRTPRYQARDLAARLGALAGAAVVLGSATPSVESYGRASNGAYRRVALPDRTRGARPRVEVVDLRAELAAGNRGLLSRRLVEAIASLDREAGDRVILVINRRGAASVVLCRDCGHVETCPECGHALVFHASDMALRCHHCGSAWPAPSRCRSCGSPRIRYLGGGTERVEHELHIRFPELRVGRLDRDVVARRGAAQRVVDAFIDGAVDVLVGTSLVAKGFDVPEVTLVGIVSADVALNLPDERAAERTYQLLVQALGRAGRGERPGTGIIQTYLPDHPVIRAAASGDATAFYDAELEARRRFSSPPFGELVKLTVALPDSKAAEHEAHRFADELRERARGRHATVEVVGPAPAYVPRRAGRWRWHVILRGQDPVALLDGGVDAPWSADVDPESLL
jgi:primosomal protein N' (replication factor Y)